VALALSKARVRRLTRAALAVVEKALAAAKTEQAKARVAGRL
jgi:hypothetical protein